MFKNDSDHQIGEKVFYPSFDFSSLLSESSGFSTEFRENSAETINRNFDDKFGWDPELTDDQLFLLLLCGDMFVIDDEIQNFVDRFHAARSRVPHLHSRGYYSGAYEIEIRRNLLRIAHSGLLVPASSSSNGINTTSILALRKATEEELQDKTPLYELGLDKHTHAALKRNGFRHVEKLIEFVAEFGPNYLEQLQGISDARQHKIMDALSEQRATRE